MTSTKLLGLSSPFMKMQFSTCTGNVWWQTLRTATHSCARILETHTCCYVCNFIKAVRFWTHLSFWDVLNRLWKWEIYLTFFDAENLIQSNPCFQHSHFNLGSSFWCWKCSDYKTTSVIISKHIDVQIPLTSESPNFKTFQAFHKVFLNIKATQHSNKKPCWSFVPLELEVNSS